jgi:hypothetical protein
MRYRGISLAAAGLILSASLLAAQATPASPPAPAKPAAAPKPAVPTTPAVAPTPAAAPAAPVAPAAPIRPIGNEIELGRKFTQWLFAAQFDSLFAHAGGDGQEALGKPEEMQGHLDELVARLGEESDVIEEKVVMRNGMPQYWRTSHYTLASEPFMLRWVIAKGQIMGIGMNPASMAPPIDAEQ